MTTAWIGGATIVALDKAVGNLLASRLDPDGGEGTFDDKYRVSQGGTPVGWIAYAPLKATGLAAMQEFASAGPYPIMNALGFDDAAVASYKALVFIDYGDRDAVAARVAQFVASLGYAL